MLSSRINAQVFRFATTLGVVALAFWLLVAVASADTPGIVTVRVEGAAGTLLSPTQVTTTVAPMVREGHSCSGSSAADALQLATSGDWEGKWFESFGDFLVEAIEGDSYANSPDGYWAFWVNDKPAAEGVCKTELEPGASVLFFPECFGECPAPPSPLGIEAPAVAEVGRPFKVAVIAYANPSGAASPAAGATVAYEGVNATTDEGGHVTLTFAHTGQTMVRASRSDAIRTETVVCVHQPGDGGCGTAAGATNAAGSQTGVGSLSAAPPPYKGPYALVPHLTGLLDGHVYRHGRAPRVLAGGVTGHTAIASVSLVLRRSYRGRCWAFDGTKAEFVRARCGTGHPFEVSTSGQFSYLLPAALAPGRYVLDIEATDAAGNRTTLARGTSRIVFYVR